MAPIVELSDDYLKAMGTLGINYTRRHDLESSVQQVAELDRSKWIVIPKEFTDGKYKASVNPVRLSHSPEVERVAKELGLQLQNTAKDSLGRGYIGNVNWFDSLKTCLSLGGSTLPLNQFNDFGRLLYDGMRDKIKVYDVSGKQLDDKFLESIFHDIFRVQSPWRAEHLDAYFEQRDGGLYVLTGNKSKEEKLEEGTLMKDKLPGISLEDWLDSSHTHQGFPTKKINSGNLFYWKPENNGVAGFYADGGRASLDCNGHPSYWYSSLGVRVAKQHK